MAQEFLNQLLRIENTVQVDGLEAPTCMICLESYGSLNSSNGAVECSIRLPCNHLVGSICIATWLRDNNSCPLCRRTFFPAQPRLTLEHDIMHERASGSTLRMGIHFDPTDPAEICIWLCEELVLGHELRIVAQAMSDPLWRRLHVQHPDCNAAVCVFIAWHFLNPDETVANFLADLSHTIQLGEDQIRSTYRRIYPNRMELIVPEVLPGLAEYNTEGFLAFLPRPNVNNHITHRDDDHETANSAEIGYDGEDWEGIRPSLTEALGDVVLSGVVRDLAEKILDELDDREELFDRIEMLRGAACVFTACHLLGVEMSYGDIASIHSVSEQGLRECYAHIWRGRSGLISYRLAETMGTGNLERVLGALPALNWPSL